MNSLFLKFQSIKIKYYIFSMKSNLIIFSKRKFKTDTKHKNKIKMLTSEKYGYFHISSRHFYFSKETHFNP